MRELARSIARHNMKVLGIPHINKKRLKTDANPKGKSYFAEHWREYVSVNVNGKPKKKKARPFRAWKERLKRWLKKRLLKTV